LFADGTALLRRQNDPTVCLSTGDPLLVERTVVPDVETVQNAPVSAGVAQVLIVASIDHSAVRSGQDIDTPGTQRYDESVLHCILVEVQPNSAHL